MVASESPNNIFSLGLFSSTIGTTVFTSNFGPLVRLRGKVQTIILHFSKHSQIFLESSLKYVFLLNDRINPADMVKQVRDRIDGNIDQGKESSYGMFLRFLGT